MLRYAFGHKRWALILNSLTYSGDPVRYNLLGQTGLYVSELCLGTMTFGGTGHWQNIGRLQLDAV